MAAGIVIVELLLEPGVELVFIGEDTRPGRAVEAVDGQGHLDFPSLASAHVTTQEGGNLLPRFENLPFVHLSSPGGSGPGPD